MTCAYFNGIVLNPAAESLTGWTDYDARNRPIEAVFQIIHEVTRQPVIQPVKEVIEHGIVRNLAQFTLLIAKNGSERSIDDSASPIRDEKGDLDAVVLIFRDTTERRLVEKQREEDRATARSSSQSCRTPSSSSTATCGSGRPIVRSMRPSTLHRKRR